jgi:putative nucleotidyltransferase with HDIG domain
MTRLCVISDSPADADSLRRQLADVFDVHLVDFQQIAGTKPDVYTLVDVDLKNTSYLLALKEWMKSKPKAAKAIFLAEKNSRIEAVRAQAIGATDVLHRPADAKALLRTLWSDFTTLSARPSGLPVGTAQGIVAANDGLQSIFSSALLGEPLDRKTIGMASEAVVSEVESQGLSSWVDTVRKHHSQTYQHCLLVTGLAVAFGQHLGLTQIDRKRLSFAALLHDIGKARVPVAILEKPAALDAEERAIMNQHPQFGADALASATGLHPEMLDMVLHHHEMLDGSGYPHGLKGNEISDLVRIITIADIFGALIEQRPYRPPLSNEAAYKVLLDMGPKLDKSLVSEFRFAYAPA